MVRLELTSIVVLSIIFPIITIQALPIKLHAPYGRQDKIFTCNKSYSTTNGTILHYVMTNVLYYLPLTIEDTLDITYLLADINPQEWAKQFILFSQYLLTILFCG